MTATSQVPGDYRLTILAPNDVARWKENSDEFP